MANLSAAPPNLREDTRSSVIVCNITVVVLATIAVAARSYARRIRRDGFGLDDYLIAAALVVGWGMVGATIAAADNGLGRHLQEVLMTDSPSSISAEGQAYLASTLLYAVTIALVKISALFLYIRSFDNRTSLRVAAWVIGACTVIWSIAVVVVSCLQCQPIAAIWDPSVQGNCIDSWLFSVIFSAINTTTDLVLLVLPIPALLGLHLSRFTRFSLVGVFLGGIIVCVFSILRLVAFADSQPNDDATWNQGMVAIWTVAEPCLGIVIISLPTFGPLFRSFSEGPSYPLDGQSRSRDLSPKSSRKSPISFDWSMIELVKPRKSPEPDDSPGPREGVIEVRTTWETRHSIRKTHVNV